MVLESEERVDAAYLSRIRMTRFSPARAIMLLSGDQADWISPKPQISGVKRKI